MAWSHKSNNAHSIHIQYKYEFSYAFTCNKFPTQINGTKIMCSIGFAFGYILDNVNSMIHIQMVYEWTLSAKVNF